MFWHETWSRILFFYDDHFSCCFFLSLLLLIYLSFDFFASFSSLLSSSLDLNPTSSSPFYPFTLFFFFLLFPPFLSPYARYTMEGGMSAGIELCGKKNIDKRVRAPAIELHPLKAKNEN